MNILSIDTSTEVLSIALKTDSSYEERLVKGNFSPSENLLREIVDILGRAGLELKDLDLLATTAGPGSFTGLRISMATLKAIRTAAGSKLVSVPTLEVISHSAAVLYKGAILSVIDAKKKRFYLELRKDGDVIVPARDGNAEDVIEILKTLGKVLVTGPDAIKFSQKLLELDGSLELLVDGRGMTNLSSSLISLALEKLEREGEDEIGAGPLYIRRSDAEEALIKKINEGA